MWSDGIINPMHKKGSQNIEDNCRKVTVMPALWKVFESILNSRLTYRNVVLDLDDKFQYGFKENARTTGNIFILRSIIQHQKLKISHYMYVLWILLRLLTILIGLLYITKLSGGVSKVNC